MHSRLAALVRISLLALIGLGIGGCAYTRREPVAERLVVPADVIIVPGYALGRRGRGTPLLWNRMVMAKIAFARGDAPTLILSGGVPKAGVTEAERMRAYGLELGIPAERMILEPRATTTVENGRFSARLMVEHGFQSAILISDPRHLRRAVPVFRDAFDANGLLLYWTPVDLALVRPYDAGR